MELTEMLITNIPNAIKDGKIDVEAFAKGVYLWAVVTSSACGINIWKSRIEPKIGVHEKRLKLALGEDYAEVLKRELCWLKDLLGNLYIMNVKWIRHELLLEVLLRAAALAGREVRYEHGAVGGVHYIVVYVGELPQGLAERLIARYIEGGKLLKDGELGEATFL